MLGKRDPQHGLFSASSRLPVDLEDFGVYGRVALDGRRIFRDTDFAGAYSKRGRSSAPPSLLALSHLLQVHEGISDAEVIERTKYDLRWKVALDLDPMQIVPPFVKSTFQGFRARLALHDKEKIAFEKSVRLASEAGLFPKELKAALDSSPIRGRGAIKDTFNLISDAIRSTLRAIAKERGVDAKELATKTGVERHFSDESIKGQVSLDWNDEQAKSAFLASLLEDCRRVQETARLKKYTGEEMALLKKLLAQDVDDTGDEPTIRDGVAKDRTVSVHDPEMRHGRKSSGKVYNGHKAHIAVETTTGIITALDVTTPGTPDGSKVAELIKETERLTGAEVTVALGDSAYSSSTAVAQAEQVDVQLVAKLPDAPKGKFGPRHFKVSEDRSSAKCPAGHRSTKQGKSKDTVVHRWPVELCATCPLRGQCLGKSKDKSKGPERGRTLTVGPDFHARLERGKFARSVRGRALLKWRVVAEHAIGRAKHHGAGAARYFGRAKTRVQWWWTAALENLQRIWSLVGEVPAARKAALA
jgi:hypothetical protein